MQLSLAQYRLSELRERFYRRQQRRFIQTIEADSRFRGQYGQDKFVYESFFAARTNPGTFVDIGAYDGELFSNTWFFEKELGWTGLAIEPNPVVFERLRLNRRCQLVNGGIAAEETNLPFLQVTGYGETLSGFEACFAPDHAKRIDQALAIHGGAKIPHSVPCLRLQRLLDLNKISRIDFLSVDTEGGELGILNTIDWTRTRVQVIAIEQNDGCWEIRRFLKRQGMSLKAILGGDAIYASHSISNDF